MLMPKNGNSSNQSSGKRMVTVFFMKYGFNQVNFTEIWCIDECPLIRLSKIFDVIWRRLEKTELRELILHDDNARPHRV